MGAGVLGLGLGLGGWPVTRLNQAQAEDQGGLLNTRPGGLLVLGLGLGRVPGPGLAPSRAGPGQVRPGLGLGQGQGQGPNSLVAKLGEKRGKKILPPKKAAGEKLQHTVFPCGLPPQY